MSTVIKTPFTFSMGDAEERTAVAPFFKKTEMKVIIGLCLIHFIGDFYISFVNPLLPSFVEKFSLTLTEVGLLAGLNRLLAFVVQLSVGYLTDPWFQYRKQQNGSGL